MRSPWLRVECGVFLILLGSYAYFWHSRDWNTASRLMLTYAMVDRGTVCLDGLSRQTGDIAWFQGHYYCDKFPGFSLVAAIPYALTRWILRLPPHPRDVEAMAYWPADYWVTLGTSGLFTALTAVLLVRMARKLGCSPRTAAIPALAYGLATPAYVYATLAYGHQLSAFALFGAFWLLWSRADGRESGRLVAAGFLASWAAVTELQVGPASAILAVYLAVQCLIGRRRPEALAYFGLGAALPALALLGYNVLGVRFPLGRGLLSPCHRRVRQSPQPEESARPPRPNLDLVAPLLWGEQRGLLFYAPILLLAIPGWFVLAMRRQVSLAACSLAVCPAVFLVNLSYPEWTGGWSTGPRLLLPLLPFAMIPVAALLADGVPARRLSIAAALGLAGAGGVLMLLFQGAGARLPQNLEYPLREVVWPLWQGHSVLPTWWTGGRFTRTIPAEIALRWLGDPALGLRAVQFLPLVLGQLAAILTLLATTKAASPSGADDSASSDLGVDQQEKGRRADEDARGSRGRAAGSASRFAATTRAVRRSRPG